MKRSLRYVLSAISFDKQHYGGTLRHPDLCLDNTKSSPSSTKYFIEDVDDAEGTDYVYRRRGCPTNDGQDKNYSPIESINFSRNKVVSFYRYQSSPKLEAFKFGTHSIVVSACFIQWTKRKFRPEIKGLNLM